MEKKLEQILKHVIEKKIGRYSKPNSGTDTSINSGPLDGTAIGISSII